ncbi:MAG: LCP family protein [Clostridia bacterium]|nr:LCP family protein [Clostridia bacterium]
MRNRRSVVKIFLILACFIIGAALLVAVFGLIENKLDKADDDKSSQDGYTWTDQSGDRLYYESAWYAPNESIETVLVLGIDKSEDASENRQNSEQVDFLALVVFNKEEKSYRILHLNRDTITDIPQTDAFGEVYGYEKGQLALSHTYGNDDKVRCRNTVNTVEKLLYGINIDHYVSMTMDAVAILNDSVGGVTLSLMDDFTDLDETFVQGALVTLRGDQALTYVRARASQEDSSNLHRMERQKQYISALIDKLNGFDLDKNTETMMEVNKYLVSDSTADQLSKWVERIEGYENKGTFSLEGEAIKGTQYMEYYINEQAAKELVIEMFYSTLEMES